MTLIREAVDDDALDLIELIGSVFGEYRGCVLDVDGEMPELRGLASWAKAHGGGFWVAEDGGRLVGMGGYSEVVASSAPAGFAPAGAGIELKKLYVHRRVRGTGLGARLLERVENVAVERSCEFIEMWSDTRFTTAHAFYERRGYERGPATRDLHDKSASVEFYFKKRLAFAAPRPQRGAPGVAP